jgi:DNA-binding NarL/FixJ family response regulator
MRNHPGMRNMTILTITRSPEWLDDMRPSLHATGRSRLVVAGSMEEAGRLLDVAEPELIIVHETSDEISYEQLDHLLWANSITPRPAPVMVVVNSYSAEQATTMFQMGVDEYICSTEHGDRMDSILNSLLPPATPVRPAPQPVRAPAPMVARTAYRHPVAFSLA